MAELSSKPQEQGILQGSALGPILFNLFLSPLGRICQAQGIKFAGYADDTQNYMHFRPFTNLLEPQITCIRKLELCLADVRSWMQGNLLKLNVSITEFIIFGTRQYLNKVGTINIMMDNDVIQIVPSVTNLWQALVLSCLDYCNSMLLGIPIYNIQKIQCIHNMSARIILQLDLEKLII